MSLSWGSLRIRGAWVLVLPFFWFATPRGGLLVVGAVLAVVGLAIRAWAASTIHKSQVLAVTGAYAHTRNPLYLGSFVLGLGVVIAAGQASIIALYLVLFAIFYRQTMAAEAAHLEGIFGEAYREYAQAVPLFFPRLRPWDGGGDEPEYQASRYKINREYEALLGSVVVFAVLIGKWFWWA